MRSSTEQLRPPGVYPARGEITISPLQIADTRTVGFVGLTHKGPIDEPVQISSWTEFTEVYGYTSDHYLSDSVEAFFRNGGRNCYIVRVAHVPREGSDPGPEEAASAEQVVADDWKKPVLRVRALNQGRWGNGIWMRFAHSSGPRALLTRDLEVGSGEAHVSSTRGFEVGALVRVYDRESSDYVVISEVGERLLRWSAQTPVNRKHRAAAPTHLEVMEFELHVALRDRREVFKGLQLHPSSRRYAPDVVAEGSRLVRLDDLRSKSPPPHNLPVVEPLSKLEGGRDGIDTVTPEDFIGHDNGPGDRAGLMALAAIDEIGLLACPDSMVFLDRNPGPAGEMRSQRVQDVMVDLCENSKDRFAILDCPRTRVIEEVQRWRRRTDSSFCAYYWPWIKVAGKESHASRELPPSGIMAGVYAARDTEGGVHHAPANLAITGAEDLSVRVTEDHLGVLNAEGINAFRIQRGVRPWGARTASSDPAWRYINVRRLFIMLRRSLEEGMAWATFEPNDQPTWSTVQTMVEQFLGDLFRRGMFTGGNASEAFYVKCDAEINSAELVDGGQMVCQIGVAPVSPAEFIIITTVQDMGAEQA